MVNASVGRTDSEGRKEHDMSKTLAPQTDRTYTNVALTLIAGILAVQVLNQPGLGGLLPQASAQPSETEFSPDDPSGRISAAEQRKQMIAELRGMSARLDRVEAALTRGVSVKVTDMPAVRINDPRADARPQK